MRSFVKNQRARYLFSLLSSILLLGSLLSCSSSDTRSQAKSAASGTGGTTTPLSVSITSPVNGATVTFVAGTSGVTFSAVSSGGTGAVTITWLIVGPKTSNTATGENPTITFLETGVHTITVTGTDSTGATDTETITITVAALSVEITSPTDGDTITVDLRDSPATYDVTFTAEFSGGTSTVTLTWLATGPTREDSFTGNNATITFFETGAYTITVTATDINGTTATDTITITIASGTSL